MHDTGPDPLTGLVRAPGGSAGGGFGLWLIHQFTNIDIAIAIVAADGFTVRLRGGSLPAPPLSPARCASALLERRDQWG